MNKRALTYSLLSILLALAVTALGDESVRSTQEELRRRNVYFGDVDGRSSRELEEALRRYQSRKGLSSTGKTDRETLRSLGLATRAPGEPVPKDLIWPEEPVLKSDSALEVAAAAEEVSETSGVSMHALVERSPRINPRKSTAPVKTASGNNTPATTTLVTTSPRFTPGNDARLRSDLTDFLRDYLSAVGRNRLEDELHFYADRVDYLGNGNVDRRVVEQSLRRYYQRWPKRSYAQVGPIAYRVVPGRGEIVVNFQTRFSLKNSKSRVNGQTASQVVINAATADPRIVSITERRIRQ